MELKDLQSGTQNFAKLIKDGSYYVDKTMIIKELLQAHNAVNLITRPRRFGKSLMIDMLYNFFSQTADHSIFNGLAISSESDICKKYMGKFPVILLDFSGFSSASYRDALYVLAGKIANLALSFRPIYNSGKMNPQDKALMETYFALRDLTDCPEDTENFAALLRNAPYNICSILHEYYGKNVVVLIDEYDVPLNKAYLGGFYDSMVELIRLMFEQLLKTTKILEFSVITGCLRISKESIFTGMNNISVWGREDNFSREYFGFTEKEVVDLLSYYSLNNVLDSARAWYDGYLFGNEHVYCPWDIIRYVVKCRKGGDTRPVNYWTDSSDNGILISMLQESDAAIQKDYLHLLAGKTVQKMISEALTYRDLNEPGDNIWSILVATGYLTIERYIDDADDVRCDVDAEDGLEDEDDDEIEVEDPFSSPSRLCELKIPNGENRQLFGSLLHNWINKYFHTNTTVITEFCAAFPKGDPDTVEKRLRKILHDVTSARDMSAQNQQKEYFYHGTVLGLLYNKWNVRSNIQSGDGYCDIGFFARKKLAIVIEMKFNSTDLESGAQEALNQIEKKRYADEFFRDGATKVLRYGIACYRDDCRVLLDAKTTV